MTRLDYVVLLGHFEPFLASDAAALHRALEAGRRVIVLVGAARKPRTIRHPWTAEERGEMVMAAAGDDAERVVVRTVREFLYSDEQWMRAVQEAVDDALGSDKAKPGAGASMGITAPKGDASSAKLALFPQWTPVDAPAHSGPTAADVRDRFLASAGPLDADVPPAVLPLLDAFRRTSAFARLVHERELIRAGKAKFSMLEFPPVFVTVDAVVVHSGHVLLIERGGEPGKGLWALPGGFLDQEELLFDACLRELREETNIDLPEPALRGAVRGSAVLDHPERSLRGRTITHAWYFRFESGPLPAIHAGDDAKKARWVPLAEAFAMEPQFFDDHFEAMSRFVNGA